MPDPDDILLSADERMDGAVQALKRELNGVRSGRAHPSLIETLTSTTTAPRRRSSSSAPSTRPSRGCSPSRSGTAVP